MTIGQNREEILLVYDRECPVCLAYSRLAKIREELGDLKIINARENSEVMKEITSLGHDIDQGMVLKMGEKLFYGNDALHALALISSRSGLFNRINHMMFKSKNASAIFYPILKFFRNTLLKILNKIKINNLGNNENYRF